MRALGNALASALLALLVVAAPAAAASGSPAKLVPGGLSAVKEPAAGSAVRIGFAVTNEGRRAERPRSAYLALVAPGAEDRRLGQLALPRLAPGERSVHSATRAVRAAATPGTYRARVCVRSGGRLRCARSRETIVLEPPALSALPDEVDFDPVLVGSRSPARSVAIENTGDTAAGAGAVSIDGAGFELAGNGCGPRLPAGDTCEARVRFAPASPGPHAATLRVRAAGAEARVSLTGTGLAPPELTVQPPSHDFGSRQTGTQSDEVSFTVSNEGDAPTSPLAASLGGADPAQFLVGPGADECSGEVLGPGATCTIAARFAPTVGGGAKAATLDVTATAGGGASASLSGTAIAPSDLVVSPASRDFGAVRPGSFSSQQTFTVTNVGDLPSGLLTVAGAGSLAQFSFSPGTCLAQTLAAGESCTFGVRFAPLFEVGATATIGYTASPGGDAIASVSGQGTDL